MKRDRVESSSSDEDDKNDESFVCSTEYDSGDEERCRNSIEEMTLRAGWREGRPTATVAPIFGFTRGKKGRIQTKRPKTNTEEEERIRYMNVMAKKLGSAEVARNILEAATKIEDHESEEMDALIAICIRSNMSQRSMRVLFHIGSGRYARIVEGKCKRQNDAPSNKKEVTPEMLKYFELNVNAWELEEGFPCAHRNLKHYVSNGTTWKVLWEQYQQQCERDGVRWMAHKTWMEYRKRLFPTIALNRVKEDVCDHCVKLRARIADENTSKEDREEVTNFFTTCAR